jgi:hypothetical protein
MELVNPETKGMGAHIIMLLDLVDLVAEQVQLVVKVQQALEEIRAGSAVKVEQVLEDRQVHKVLQLMASET